MGVKSGYNESRIVVVPVPYDGTTSYRTGSRNGPEAIIKASRQFGLYDIETGKETALETPIHTTDEVEPDTDSPLGTIKRVEQLVSEIIEKDKFPVVLGGEHSISLGPVLALKRKHPDISVLAIDAHADLLESYEGSRYNHACVLRRIREEVSGPVVQAGVRNMGRSEAEYIKKNRLKKFIFGKEFGRDEINGLLSENVYVTIDLDGFDPSQVPGVGTPEPGGLMWGDVIPLLKAVCSQKNVVGFDITELSPLPVSNVSELFAAKLAYKFLSYRFGGL